MPFARVLACDHDVLTIKRLQESRFTQPLSRRGFCQNTPLTPEKHSALPRADNAEVLTNTKGGAKGGFPDGQ